MLVGVVSDTHNNHKNIDQIVSLFNKKNVQLVVHTGDITNSDSLEKFSELNCQMYGVFGNNDRNEEGLVEVISRNSFNFQNPPYKICKHNRTIAIFHEPDSVEEYILDNKGIDIILHGHTHRYREEFINQTLIFNPGESAGIVSGKNAIGLLDLSNISVERIFF